MTHRTPGIRPALPGSLFASTAEDTIRNFPMAFGWVEDHVRGEQLSMGRAGWEALGASEVIY